MTARENFENVKVPRMRTIDDAYKFILSADSETEISRYLLRKICENDMVHHIKIGKKLLVDIDDLQDKLAGSFYLS